METEKEWHRTMGLDMMAELGRSQTYTLGGSRLSQDDQEDDGGQYAAHLAGVQSDAWAEFLMTGRPAALAVYLQAGGEVDEWVKKNLIDILRNGPKLINKGGRDAWRDYSTYVDIKLTRTAAGVSKTEACRRYAKETNQELRAVEMQYERGRKVFSPESDLFELGDNDREK